MKTDAPSKETSLEFFPALDGLILDQRYGFYVEIRSSKVVVQTGDYPQGIQLSLTLRDDAGRPLMKFWNRLDPIEKPPKGGPLIMSIYGFDGDGGMNLFGKMKSFSSVSELLDEFFANVDLILPEED